MPYDLTSGLWAADDSNRYFSDFQVVHRRQGGSNCVANTLAMLTGKDPYRIKEEINTQSPISWSDFLRPHGFQLAYCNVDFRRLKHFVDELVAYNDLFLLAYYSPLDARDIGREPDQEGWISGSHIVLLNGDTVHDGLLHSHVKLHDYQRLESYVKRIFRVLPVGNSRSL